MEIKDLFKPFGLAVRLIITGGEFRQFTEDQRLVFLNMKSELPHLSDNPALKNVRKGRAIPIGDNGRTEGTYYIPDLFDHMTGNIGNSNETPAINIEYMEEVLLQIDRPYLCIKLKIVDTLQVIGREKSEHNQISFNEKRKNLNELNEELLAYRKELERFNDKVNFEERNRKILRTYNEECLDGISGAYTRTAKRFELSRQRITQIVKKTGRSKLS